MDSGHLKTDRQTDRQTDRRKGGCQLNRDTVIVFLVILCEPSYD